MKTKVKKELHTKTIEELKSLVNQTREELSNLKLEKVRKKLKNTSSILQKRKDMARILTILNEKEAEK
ncbi:MAG: 50S ribosomal protein L29 [Candidatus Levybacteria bacterium]|nr:50S ribosomal protein L29 [Candidatus Levybacteria bacterium]